MNTIVSFFIDIYEAIIDLRFALFPRKIEDSDRKILNEFFPYYARMDPKFQKEFEKRMTHVLTTKEFHGMGGIDEVTEKMEVLIAATIVMVIFGWKRVKLSHFRRVLIYPNKYYNKATKKYHLGEVNPQLGTIVVSWKAFLDGLTDESDGVNLGVHEVAHALKLENKIKYDREYRFISSHLMDEYKEHAQQELKRYQNGEDSFLREAATIDDDELFAVILEVFFETPEVFEEKRPEFYEVMTLILQQNPLVVSPRA